MVHAADINSKHSLARNHFQTGTRVSQQFCGLHPLLLPTIVIEQHIFAGTDVARKYIPLETANSLPTYPSSSGNPPVAITTISGASAKTSLGSAIKLQ